MAESIIRYDEYSNGNLPVMFLLLWLDFDNTTEVPGIQESELQWVLNFTDHVGCWKERVHHLIKARDEYDVDDFDIGTYTLIEDIEEYIELFEMGVDGVFTDDVGTGRVIKQLLNALEDGDGVAFDAFCGSDETTSAPTSAPTTADTTSEDSEDGKVDVAVAVIVALIALVVGACVAVIAMHCIAQRKLQSAVAQTPGDTGASTHKQVVSTSK